MTIKDMFVEDINRPINGVIQVTQDDSTVIDQEVREYVITRELKKYFSNFFDIYSKSFDTPTSDIGVWISGFFGSGKSHFLKMLSYILENKPVCGTTTVEIFREKFADDPGTFMAIDNSTRGKTDTLLFNIDVEASVQRTKTAVVKVFAKIFYKHLGFYGDDLKVVFLEQYLQKEGKTEEFSRVFEEIKGSPWVEQRKVLPFNRKAVIATLVKVLDMDEADASRWFDDKTSAEESFSIARLVTDIKDYVDNQPSNYRLVFLLDEVGQYVGTDTSFLLNLQSIVEELGSKCKGKVWVICTGQQAIDEIIDLKNRENEFSRIQSRFKTKLSLSSSSVDEVIQKRILQKKPVAIKCLTSLYDANDSVLKNLFTFSGAVGDIKGYKTTDEYVADFPFVPYQFTLMSKVFAEIRKHGNSGKHLSGGERSMLSGFQEAAQKIENNDEFSLVPFYFFYDTVHSFLDVSIRSVIDRSQRAAEKQDGIEQYDVNMLKLLYLIRYVHDDIPANLDNIVILMADNLHTDKIIQKEKVSASLNRLLLQNYIGRTNNTYNFLTDEEQDVQRDIRNTVVDSSSIINRIGGTIISDIYTTKKFRYGISDFPFDIKVDNLSVGSSNGGMQLRFMTVASDQDEKTDMKLLVASQNMAIIVLGDTNYYELTENAMKIRKYAQSRNTYSLSSSMQKIITEQQEYAGGYEKTAREELIKAITEGTFYVAGEKISIKKKDAKSMIDETLAYLVTHVYSELSLIDTNINSDAEIREILDGTLWFKDEGSSMRPNIGAETQISDFLITKDRQRCSVTMFDVQDRYQKIPYGWREIDIAGVVAMLIHEQKVSIKYAGSVIKPDNPKIIEMLRKKNEIGRTVIAIRHSVNIQKINKARAILRDYFEIQDVPSNEDELVAFIENEFTTLLNHYVEMKRDYYTRNPHYPDRDKVNTAYELAKEILAQKDDHFALIDKLIENEDELFDNKEAMSSVEEFFNSQVKIFDKAYSLVEGLRDEKDYFRDNREAFDALNKIEEIIEKQTVFDYNRIHELHSLVAVVTDAHEILLSQKRKSVLKTIEDCWEAVKDASRGIDGAEAVINEAESNFNSKKAAINSIENLVHLDGLVIQIVKYKDNVCNRIEKISTVSQTGKTEEKPNQKKNIRTCQKSVIFNSKRLNNEVDIDKYLDEIRVKLVSLLNGYDGIDLN